MARTARTGVLKTQSESAEVSAPMSGSKIVPNGTDTVSPRDAALARLAGHSASLKEHSDATETDLYIVADGITAADWEALVVKEISRHRFGRSLSQPNVCRLVKAFRSADRIGGEINTQGVADALGIGTGTVSRYLNTDENGEAVKKKSDPATPEEQLDALLKSLKKITGEIVGKASADAQGTLLKIKAEADRIVITGADQK